MGITRRRQCGQVLVIFPIAAIAILSVIGLLYTFGQVLAQRRALQTAADAASLSGSWHVLQQLASGARSDGIVYTSVVDYANTVNGLPSDALNPLPFYIDATGQPATASGQPAAFPSPCPVRVGSLGGGAFPIQARGVHVSLARQVPSILPGFVKILQTGVVVGASATARPTTLVAVLVPESVNPCDPP